MDKVHFDMVSVTRAGWDGTELLVTRTHDDTVWACEPRHLPAQMQGKHQNAFKAKNALINKIKDSEQVI